MPRPVRRYEKLLLLAKPFLEKNDFGISHTERVLDIARKQFRIPKETEELIVVAITLHDIGGRTIKEQYQKGPEIATVLLRQLGYSDPFIEEVCEIIRTHHDRPNNPTEAFKVVFDADQLARFSNEEFPIYESQGTDWNQIIERMYAEKSKKRAKESLKNKKE